MPIPSLVNVSVDRGDGYVLYTDRNRLDYVAIHQWLSTDSYWAMGRCFEAVKGSIANSLPFGLFFQRAPDEAAEQVAFARAITDYRTSLWIKLLRTRYICLPFRYLRVPDASKQRPRAIPR